MADVLRRVSGTSKYSIGTAFLYFSLSFSLFLSWIFIPSFYFLLGPVFCSPREECSTCGLLPTLKTELGASRNVFEIDIEAAGHRGGRHLRKRLTALLVVLVI